jgi:hypothetical protein
VKKGGKLHIGGYSKPLLAFTDRNGVEGFVLSLVTVEIAWDGFGWYVTGLEDDADADGGKGRYDIVYRSRDEGGSELGQVARNGWILDVNNLQSWQRSMQCNMHTNNPSDNDPTSIDLQQLSKTGSTRISNAQSTITKPFDP